MPDQQTYTISQAAAEFGVSTSTLRRWTNQGRVPFLKTPGGQRRFTREQIREIRQPLLHAAAAAREVGVSANTLRRWAQHGDIPYTKTIHGQLRFTWDNIRSIRTQMERQPSVDQITRAA